MDEWRNILAKLQAQYIHVSNEVEWDWLQEVVLVEALNPYLTRILVGDGVRITCKTWRRLFILKESVYKELCIAFLARIQFRKRGRNNDSENFTFYFGGEKQECNLAKLAWRQDSYNQSEVITEGLKVFLDHCHKTLPDGVNV